MFEYITTIGQDSHRFAGRPGLVLGGHSVPDAEALEGNSDADVILHALCNAISGLTGKPVLGARADSLCQAGITDSRAYLELALQDLRELEGHCKIMHVSISLEALRPKIEPQRQAITESIAKLLNLNASSVCLTATTGEGLTAFGRGEGIAVLCLLTIRRDGNALD